MLSLAPGETKQVTVETEGPEPQFHLALAEGETAFVTCRDSAGRALPPESKVWDITENQLRSNDMLGNLRPMRASADTRIKLSRRYANTYNGGNLPLDVRCTLYGVDNLPKPSDMGPPAEFRIIAPVPKEGAEVASGPAKPPPPGLEALIAREIPQQQASGDLPVSIKIHKPPGLAAFSDAGQRINVKATVTNDSTTALATTVTFNVTGEGWRVAPKHKQVKLNAGASSDITVAVTAPPWLAPSLSPNFAARASADASFSASSAPLAISPAALPSQPFTHWHAPEALRGGLNLLHNGLGARIIDWAGQTPDERLLQAKSRIHDGIAPHITSVNLPNAGLTLRLAAKAPIAGVMIQLRTTATQLEWPAEVEIYDHSTEGGWHRIATQKLESIHAPQYIVFDQPVTTERLRFTFPRCNGKCTQTWVQEIQAIAVPGHHPPDLAPINIADPDLGGHVVWSTDPFGGPWNSEFLKAEAERSNPGWARAKAPNQIQVTLAFHQNRAALIQALNWVGDPDDEARLSAARVEASTDGPNGPWTSVGELPAPPLNENLSTLTFDTPVWARYLRLSFGDSSEKLLNGPDAVEVIEAPGTSVLGLWEDDQPRAAYEAIHNVSPTTPTPPLGGPTREAAVAIPMGTPQHSSVVIERNEDWWKFDVPNGTAHKLQLAFQQARPQVVGELTDAQGKAIALKSINNGQAFEAILAPGNYVLRIYEPPRSVVISWDTSGSVSAYIPRTLAAIRTWGRALKPGRDALQLLPFGPKGFLLDDWAETPEALETVLRNLPTEASSNSEMAMLQAAKALADRQGARGIVIMTDAETVMDAKLWPELLKSMPRVVALSVDSNLRANAAVMMDWANLNQGRFQRVIGPLGLADSLEMANALFRAPKSYTVTASLEELVEPVGEATLTITPAAGSQSTIGAVELILDASGSMLQRMEGRKRIDIAHEALTNLVGSTLPENSAFAFRAFGLEEDACRSELIVPLGPLDRAAATKAIKGVPAINLAKTAIADSLRAAATDLANTQPPRVVVLVTDGEETCEGDPQAAIAELRAAGLDARVNIVGFAIDDAELAATFASWAEAGGGTYFDARGADSLEQSIADALRPRFDITRTYLDGRTEVVGRVALGESLTIPAGRLTIAPGSGAVGASVDVYVQPEGKVTIEYAPEAGLEVASEPD